MKMKKMMTIVAMLACVALVQAQSKFHDVEANEAKGPVKSITTSMMGMTQTTTFDENGKMTSGNMSDAVYDANGYLQSATMDMQGQGTAVKFTWENGHLKTQTMNMMGQEVKTIFNYNADGVATSVTLDMGGGQTMDMPYSNIKLDDHGNWISRSASMMGQEMTFTRTIEYFQ